MTKRKPKPTEQLPAVPLPAPSASEQALIGAARTRLKERPARLRVKVDSNAKGEIARLGAHHSDHDGWIARLQNAFGSRGTDFAASELNRLIVMSRLKDGSVDNVRVNGLLAIIDGIAPANEVEAMLGAQLAFTHNLAMELIMRAKQAEQLPQFESAGHMAAKLLRAFAGHAELLHKLKQGGRQTVRVEHVHVHSGGQAIVGHVQTGGRGMEKIESQPHAPHPDAAGQPRSLTAEQGATLPSPNPEREPVPVAEGEGAPPL